MPANTRHFGQLDSDYPPFASSGTYCESVFPMKEVTFDSGFVLPREQREAAGSCGFSAKTPSQAPSPPSWDLPSMVGMDPGLKTTRFWSTLDSALTGEGPRPGGWRQPAAARTRGAQGGGKRKRRTVRRKPAKKGKSKKGRRGVRKTRRRKGKGGRRTQQRSLIYEWPYGHIP